MQPKISIVIPVYDVSIYLRKCVDSVITQTLDDIEIILVNDCSPDPVDDYICTEYSDLDPRVKYVTHKENKGLGGARNTGLENATGEYIWFIDSDDFIDTNACEFLYRLASEHSADVVAFSATSHVNGCLDLVGKPYYHYKRDINILDKVYLGPKFIETASLYNSFHVSACLHLYRNDLISKYRFREGVLYEDTDLIPIVIHNSKSVFCTDYSPYYRLIREDSITQSAITEKMITDQYAAIESLLEYSAQTELDDEDFFFWFVRRQYNAVKQWDTKQYSALSYELNSKLNDKYRSVLAIKDQIDQSLTYAQLESRYRSLNKEIYRIKASRLWKLYLFLEKLRQIFPRANPK